MYIVHYFEMINSGISQLIADWVLPEQEFSNSFVFQMEITVLQSHCHSSSTAIHIVKPDGEGNFVYSS